MKQCIFCSPKYSSNYSEFQIVATEKSEPTNIGTATVTVNLQDVNDEYPAFINEPYVFTVKENQPIGTIVGKVTAEDKDAEDNGLT